MTTDITPLLEALPSEVRRLVFSHVCSSMDARIALGMVGKLKVPSRIRCLLESLSLPRLFPNPPIPWIVFSSGEKFGVSLSRKIEGESAHYMYIVVREIERSKFFETVYVSEYCYGRVLTAPLTIL